MLFGERHVISGSDVDAAMVQLRAALDEESVYVQTHTKLLVRAVEWTTHKFAKSLHIKGDDIQVSVPFLADHGAYAR